jgi:hypothetical protein
VRVIQRTRSNRRSFLRANGSSAEPDWAAPAYWIVRRFLKTFFEQDSDPDQVIDQPFSAFWALKEHQLGFFSARFLRSTSIFSIKVLISGAGTLRVEFIALPSSKLVGERLTKFRDKAIKQTPRFSAHTA